MSLVDFSCNNCYFTSVSFFFDFFCLTPRVPQFVLHTKPPKKLTVAVLGGVLSGFVGTPFFGTPFFVGVWGPRGHLVDLS